MNKVLLNFLIVAFLTLFISSCRFYQSRMFHTHHEYIVDSIQRQISQAEKNYVIKKNDYLSLHVYSNGGEKLIDPDNQLAKTAGSAEERTAPPKFLVRSDGKATFPMVGDLNLEGFTLHQADSILSIAYSKYYESPFVLTKLVNKRVVVIGPTGGKVLPLDNENINLIEVIALYGGMPETGKSYKIRLIRGDLKNPNVNIIDLSTIEGMKAATLDIQPNDIVYIETQRKIISESIREILPILSVITSIIVTIVVIIK